MQIELTREGCLAGPMAGICARPGTRLRRFAAALAALCLCTNAASVEMGSLYTAQVPFDQNDPDAQNQAYQAALTEVLVRVTGMTSFVESGPLDRPGRPGTPGQSDQSVQVEPLQIEPSRRMADLFPNPARYVQQYRSGPDSTLVVTFEGRAIENVLRQAGVPIWGSDRPLTLIWIAVDWGQGEREIVAADDPERMSADARSIDRNRLLRERVAEVATGRGIPVLFPLLDTEDLESISFTDIWGGFDDLLLKASARYEAESVLVGRIRTDSLQTNRWSWYYDGDRASWNGQTEDIINLLADSLAARSIVDPTSPVETIRLTINGIDSVNAFGQVQQLMENLRGIDEIMIDTVAGDRIVYEVRIQGGIERLKRALELNNVLEPIDQFDGSVEVIPFDNNRNPFETFDNRDLRQATLEYLYRSD